MDSPGKSGSFKLCCKSHTLKDLDVSEQAESARHIHRNNNEELVWG